jgi:hypothetical protein
MEKLPKISFDIIIESEFAFSDKVMNELISETTYLFKNLIKNNMPIIIGMNVLLSDLGEFKLMRVSAFVNDYDNNILDITYNIDLKQ